MFKILKVLRILKYFSRINFYVSRNVHIITVYRAVNEDVKNLLQKALEFVKPTRSWDKKWRSYTWFPLLSPICLIHFLPMHSFSKIPISFKQLVVVLSPNDIHHIKNQSKSKNSTREDKHMVWKMKYADCMITFLFTCIIHDH